MTVGSSFGSGSGFFLHSAICLFVSALTEASSSSRVFSPALFSGAGFSLVFRAFFPGGVGAEALVRRPLFGGGGGDLRGGGDGDRFGGGDGDLFGGGDGVLFGGGDGLASGAPGESS